jgi:hypothetical protein
VLDRRFLAWLIERRYDARLVQKFLTLVTYNSLTMLAGWVTVGMSFVMNLAGLATVAG